MVIFPNPSPMNKKTLELPLEYVDYFMLNEIEACDICNVVEPAKISKILDKLDKKFSTAKMVLTLG